MRAVDLTRIIAGDTLDFSITVPDYSAADGWTLNYRLVPRASGTAIEFSSTADGDAHVIAVSAATTAAWAAGAYSWAAYVDASAGASHTWRSGDITLYADPRTATAPLDLRTDAERALADAEAALAAWNPTMKRYVIGGREMMFHAATEILPVVGYWKAAVQRERRSAALAAGLPDPRKILVRLGRV